MARQKPEGLQDALLHRDHTNQYQQDSPSVFGLVCAGAPGRASSASHCRGAPTCCTPVHQAGTERNARSDRMGDVSTRHMLGLTRRGKKQWECVGSWSLASWGHSEKIPKQYRNVARGDKGPVGPCAWLRSHGCPVRHPLVPSEISNCCCMFCLDHLACSTSGTELPGHAGSPAGRSVRERQREIDRAQHSLSRLRRVRPANQLQSLRDDRSITPISGPATRWPSPRPSGFYVPRNAASAFRLCHRFK